MAAWARSVTLLRLLLLCLTLTSRCATQQEGDDAEPSIRLSGDLTPHHYNITIEPDMYGSTFVFNGTMTFTFRCFRTTNRIILHVKELDVSDITVSFFGTSTWSEGVPRYANHTVDNERQFLIIHLDRTLWSGFLYNVTMNFGAALNSEPLNGLYLQSYQTPSGLKYMASTQFQPTEARKTFPCLDEPALKARFSLTVIRRTFNKALSNMPVLRSVSLGGNRVADVFQTSRPMSTYLVAFAVGDFGSVNTTTRRNVTLEVVSRSEVVEQAQDALDFASEILDFFEDYFQVPFPLPKLSLLAVPSFSFGGMENWGLIICREKYLLLDSAVASTRDRFMVSVTVAHELAHMWFGDLVSPMWWDELWLNEGFASFMAYLALDDIRPQWNVMDDFVTSHLQSVMKSDSGYTSHPVYFTVNTPDEINEHFDGITYYKSASVIRMLRHAVGYDTFRNGITNYLTSMRYRSATRFHLWDALAEQSELDGHSTDVVTFMNTWILQMNYPLVTVSRQGRTLTFTQQRFLKDRTATDPGTYSPPYGYKWDIPVTYTTSNNIDFNNNQVRWLMKDANLTVRDRSLRSASWVLCNVNVNGYYRVNYDNDNWDALAQQLRTDHTVISQVNRAQIINDAWTLVNGRYLELSVALGLFEYLGREVAYIPWSAASSEFLYIDRMLMGTAIYDDYMVFIRNITIDHYNRWRIGSSVEGLSHEQTLLKTMVTTLACSSGVQACVQDARSLFTGWKNDPTNNEIDPELRESIYCNSIRYGTHSDWMFLYWQFTNETNSQEKQRMRNSLTCSRDPQILRSLLYRSMYTGVIKSQNTIAVIRWIAANEVGTPLAWDFFRDNWGDFFDRFGASPFYLASLVEDFGNRFKDQQRLQELRDFVDAHEDMGTASRAVVKAQESIRTNMRWMQRHYEPIRSWLGRQGYVA